MSLLIPNFKRCLVLSEGNMQYMFILLERESIPRAGRSAEEKGGLPVSQPGQAQTGGSLGANRASLE